MTTSPPHQSPHHLRRILRRCAAFLAVFAVVHAGFLLLHTRLPYIQSGAALVTNMKHDLARIGRPFSSPSKLRVMAFGSSKTLSGFIPALFDEQLAAAGIANVESYNFGLPGEFAFMPDLEAMAARDQTPDVALLIIPWPETVEPPPSFFHFIRHDRPVMDSLFPFRKLPRDLFIMATEAKFKPGAIKQSYLDNQRTVHQVALDRGYYFIARQSHYANDELPPTFTAPTDTPAEVGVRTIPRGPNFDRMITLCAEHRIRCIFIPNYFREGQYASPPPLNTEARAVLAGHSDFHILGPDYFRYPNKLFSDPIHTNKPGADAYTRAVAALVAPYLKEHPVHK